MNKTKKKPNDVNEVGTSCEDFSSGRVSVEEQCSPGRQSATVQNNDIFSKKKGGRGKFKQKWSKEERVVVWECYIRSIELDGREHRDYIQKLMQMWEGRDLSVRSQASILSQVKCIQKGGLLSEYEKREIERKVKDEIHNNIGKEIEEEVGEEDQEIDFDIECHQDKESVERFSKLKLVLPRIDHFKGKEGLRTLNSKEIIVLRRLREVYNDEEIISIPSLKAKDISRVMEEVNLVNSLIDNVHIGDVNVTNVNRLSYAGSYVVCERLGYLKKHGQSQKQEKPWWQRRLERSILQWRKDLSRVAEITRGFKLKEKIISQLERRYQVADRGLRAVKVFLENKIKAGSTKIRSFVSSNLQNRQNTLFQNNRRQLFKELGRNSNKQCDSPNPEKARQFWSNIWSKEGKFNPNATWLKEIEDDFSRVKQQEDAEIATEDVLKGIRKMSSWKAPGPDGVQGFWFKKFSSVHQRLVEALGRCLDDGCVPDWMVKGRTVLIQKNPLKGTSADNFRPITCLPLMWKLLTGIFAESIYKHLETNGLLKEEQKGCRKKSRGTKDQLLIDKAVMRWTKIKYRCLSMAWIDYKKAFDMVPHDWICKVMSLSKIAGNIGGLISSSMSSWQTNLTCNGEDLGSVNINRGIFQGDSLSPLIFVMIMVPLTLLLRKEEMGIFYSEINEFINHLLFMDDLKLYAQSERTLAELVAVVEKFSKDIGMEFGIEKCACISIKKGNVCKTSGIELPSGESVKTLDNEGYKYLGVLQHSDIKHKEMKLLIKDEYLRRVKAVAKSKLFAKNLFMSINSWAVSVVRYSAGVVDWREKELKDIDIKTRKILTMNGVFHRKGNVDRLYIKREHGGRGLISIEDCVKMEDNSLRRYMFREPDRFLLAANFVLADDPYNDTTETNDEFKERVWLDRDNRIVEKKMHGKYFKEIQDIGCKKRYEWISAGRITKSFEGLLFAAQEQVLPTNWLKARITGNKDDAYCRKCKKEIETVAHLISGCSALCQSEYLIRHNKMGLRVYWEICRKYGMKYRERWYEETPDKVRQSKCGNYEVWWDRPVETAKKVDHNKPDVVFINKKEKKWTIVDFSVPHDRNIVKKEEEKISNYSPLTYEIRKLHGVSTSILPLVVGALGNITGNLALNLERLDIPKIGTSLQISAVIGTAIILRKVLSLD